MDDNDDPSFDLSRNKLDRLAAQEIRRISLNQRNRLLSIHEDSLHVRAIAERYPQLALIANLRCGAWYTPPELAAECSYFKSTDGHTAQWNFSTKRSNLHLIETIECYGGCIIVDSTRRGKSMPDALSKTIPIWCTVVNLASQRRHGDHLGEANEFVGLKTPSDVLSRSEHDQIAARLDGWVKELLGSDLQVPRLSKPLRPIHITPATEAFPQFGDDLPFFPVVCLSASRQTEGGLSYATASTDQSQFTYVQGAGDDHEYWADALLPSLWWEPAVHESLLRAPEAQVKSIIAEAAKNSTRDEWFKPAKAAVSDGAMRSRVAGTRISLSRLPMEQQASHDGLCCWVQCDCWPTVEWSGVTVVRVDLPSGKKSIPLLVNALRKAIDTVIPVLLKEQGEVAFANATVKDVSGSFAVAFLALLYDSERQWVAKDCATVQEARQKLAAHARRLSKDDVRKRVQWLITDCHALVGTAGPTRAWLNRVNEVVLSYNPFE